MYFNKNNVWEEPQGSQFDGDFKEGNRRGKSIKQLNQIRDVSASTGTAHGLRFRLYKEFL
jgi:hypothetical protein